MQMLDVRQNRRARKYSNRELALRVAWGAVGPFFRFSPRLAHGWRNALLRLFGAKIGRDVRIDPSVRIFLPWNLEVGDETAIGFGALIYNLGRVSIGSQATISHRSHLCAGSHDFRQRDLPLLKPPISVGSGCWVCADAFIGPGVTVGEGAVVGAAAVVMKDVEPWTIVAGNPAQLVGNREFVPGAAAGV